MVAWAPTVLLASLGVAQMLVKMVTSLALVLGIVAVAYFVMRRRASLAGTPRQRKPSGSSARAGRGSRRGSRHAVEVIGRVGLSRASAAVAIRFGDRVLLVGASDQAGVSVLAEVHISTWEAEQAVHEWTVPAMLDESAPAERPGFIEALREATVRRG